MDVNTCCIIINISVHSIVKKNVHHLQTFRSNAMINECFGCENSKAGLSRESENRIRSHVNREKQGRQVKILRSLRCCKGVLRIGHEVTGKNPGKADRSNMPKPEDRLCVTALQNLSAERIFCVLFMNKQVRRRIPLLRKRVF